MIIRCTYLVEYKLAKGQLREIEDFIDRGQKSLFLGAINTRDHQHHKHNNWQWTTITIIITPGVVLCEGRIKRLPSLSSMASMATTASANYGRPVTKGSRLLLQVRVSKIQYFICSSYLIMSPSPDSRIKL